MANIDEIKAQAAIVEARARVIVQRWITGRGAPEPAATLAEVATIIIDLAEKGSALVPRADVEAQSEQLQLWVKEAVAAIVASRPESALTMKSEMLAELRNRQSAVEYSLAEWRLAAWIEAEVRLTELGAPPPGARE